MAAPPVTQYEPFPPESAADTHKPFIPAKVVLPEFTLPAVVVGALLGIVFGASSLYLVLKVGLTVSASIPVAVLSITLFRVFSRLPGIRKANILENNIVQTTGSAGESIAFGVGVTMPALMLLGFEMDIGRVMVVSVLGGLLGILMMIPLRRAFIVKQHGILKYPEGTACAEVLIAGEKGGTTAKTVFVGFGIAFLYQFLWQGLRLWKEVAAKPLTWFKGATPALEVNPALLGVGYIIGTRISCIMVAGGVLASFVLTPAIRLFGDGLQQPLYPARIPISKMSEGQIWHEYVLYIGAGAVAAGGIISLFQALPLIIGSIRAGVRDLSAARSGSGEGGPRTDRDLPLWIVGAGSVALVVAIWLTTPLHKIIPMVPQLEMNPVGALLIVLFGFLFVTVSSRLTGEIGSSSNPISGMTVATLLLTCLIFLALGWTHSADRLTALSIAAVVCIAASNGGTTSQDLKTGYLVGATPKWQQLSILIGALTSALVIGWILILLNNAYTVYSSKDLPVLAHPLDVAALPETEKGPKGEQVYHVWRPRAGDREGNPDEVEGGKYLVKDDGQLAYLVDPAINGKLTHRDDGTEVTRFSAPKAQLMALITDGILNQKLPWSLVLLGVSISLVLELCQVPSLPFAVGVYLPLSSSTPIFAGGLVRWVAEKWEARAGRQRSETESDSSPGVLLSTGYIAGGAIAGVLIAFLSFSDEIPNLLGKWQYSTYQSAQTEPFDALTQDAAKSDLGLSGTVPQDRQGDVKALADEIADLNSGMLPRYLPVGRGTQLKLPLEKSYTADADTTLGEVAKQTLGSASQAQLLLDLNKVTLLAPLVPLKKDTTLKLPDGKTYTVPADTTVGAVAEKLLGSANRSGELVKLNKLESKLEVPTDVVVPAGTSLRIPQGNTLALVAFGVLVLILLLVGFGWLLRSPPTPGFYPENDERGPMVAGDEMGISRPGRS